MSQRTTKALVQALLSSNYGPDANGNLPDLQPFIDTAWPLVDETVVQAAQRLNPYTLNPTQQEIIERWLAAHFYTKMDPVYQSKSSGGASGSFVRGGAEQEPYLEGAFNSDPSGTLRALIKRQVASFAWAGKPPSQQTPYCDRD